METPETPKLSEAQTNMLTLLDQVAARVIDGSIVAIAVASVMNNGLGRNAYIITPNTAVTLIGSIEVAKQELAAAVLEASRQLAGLPPEVTPTEG